MAAQTAHAGTPTTTVRQHDTNYWEQARKLVDASVVAKLEKLPIKFDKETRHAIERLQGKKSDAATRTLLECMKERLDNKSLDFQTKGKIRQVASRLEWKDRYLDDTVLAELNVIENDLRKAANENNPDSGFTELNDLLQICKQHQEISKEKRWTFKRLGKDKPVHELWTLALTQVDKLKSGIDAVTSVEPTARLVWSILNVTLQKFAVTAEKNAAAILDGFDAALRMINQGLQHEKPLREAFPDQTVGPGDHSKLFTLEKTLVSVYCRIFAFLAIAGSAFEKGSIGQRWYAFWSPDDVLSFQESVLKLETQLHHDSELIQSDKVNRKLDDFQRQSDEVIRKLKDIQSHLENFGIRHHPDHIRAWYSRLPHLDIHNARSKPRIAGTAEWIFHLTEYKDWQASSESRFLWIRGMLGTGKTILMSNIIQEHLKLLAAKRQEQPPLENNDLSFTLPDFQMAYFYFRRGDSDANSPAKAFGSCIKQLATSCDALPHNVLDFYQLKGNPASATQALVLEDYKVILEELISRRTETILFFDALDECSEPTDMFEMIQYLLSIAPRVKVILTSRDDLSLLKSATNYSLGPQESINVTAEDNGQDIRTMVRSRMNMRVEKEVKNRSKKEREKWRELQDKIEEEFGTKSEGMFQWASLHIEALMDEERRTDIEDMLGKLPKGMKETYDKIFERIVNGKASDFRLASRAFKWLLALGGSCEANVLLAAACQTLGRNEPNDVDCTLDHLINCLKSLIKQEGNKIQFCHLSVQEYGENYQGSKNSADRLGEETSKYKDTQIHQFDLPKSSFDVAKVCLWVILHHELPTRVPVFPHSKGSWCYVRRPITHYATDDNTRYLDALSRFAYENWERFFKDLEDGDKTQIIAFLRRDFEPSRFNDWSLRLAIDQSSHWLKSIQPVFNSDNEELSRTVWGELRSPWVCLRLEEVGCPSSQQSRSQCYNKSYWLLGRDDDTTTRDEAAITWRGESWSLLVDATLAGIYKKSIPFFEEALRSGRPAQLQFSYNLQNDIQAEFSITDPGQTVPISTRTLTRMLAAFSNQFRNPLDLSSLKEKLFSNEFTEYNTEGCVKELASLILFLLCVGYNWPHHWRFGDSDDKDDINWFQSKFSREEFARNEYGKYLYQHLVPPHIDMEWSTILHIVDVKSPLYDLLFDTIFGHVDGEQLLYEDVVSSSSPLIKAILNDNVHVVEWLVNNMEDINQTTSHGDYGHPMIAAFATGPAALGTHRQRIRRLIWDRARESIHHVSTTGRYGTPLIAACSNDDVQAVEELLDVNVNPNQITSVGRHATALIAACASKFTSAVKKLLEKGAEPFLEVQPPSNRQHRNALVTAFNTKLPRLVHLLCKGHGRPGMHTITNLSEDCLLDDSLPSLCQALAVKLSWFIVAGGDAADAVGNLHLIQNLQRETFAGRRIVSQHLAAAFGFNTPDDMVLNGFEKMLADTSKYCATWDDAAECWHGCIDLADRSTEGQGLSEHEMLELQGGVPRSKRVLTRVLSEPVDPSYYQFED